jgi:4-amino-4-deoxy-L-arabinose transferase-like glycosyltransferase
VRNRVDVPRPHSAMVSRPLALALLVVIVLYAALTLYRLGTSDLESDEGRFGLAARNILSDPRQLAIVSQRPLGEPGSMPYMYPLALALSVTLVGPTEFALRIVNVVAVLAGALLFGRAARLLTGDRLVSFAAFAVFLLNAGTIIYARFALPEAFVVAWGCAALYAALKASRTGRAVWAVLCGSALGVAFLAKLWLVAPFVLACASLIVAANLRRAQPIPLRLTALAAVTFVALSGTHLLFVLILAPDTWPHWRDIYYQFTFKSRVAGLGYDPDMWYRPWWFYLAAAFKASFFGLPFRMLGLVRSLGDRRTETLLVIGALLSPLVFFSFFRVKQASYVYSAFPALALLVALGLVAVLRRPDLKALLPATALSAMVATAFFALGVLPSVQWLAVLGLYALYAGGALLGQGHSPAVRRLIVAGFIIAMLAPGLSVVHRTLRHRTYYREIAAFVGPLRASTSPRDPVFTAPDSPAMEFYTLRHGAYWETFYYHESLATFERALKERRRLFYIVDPSGSLYGSKVSAEKLRALRAHTRDVTPALERALGRTLPVTVHTPLAGPAVPEAAPRTAPRDRGGQ